MCTGPAALLGRVIHGARPVVHQAQLVLVISQAEASFGLALPRPGPLQELTNTAWALSQMYRSGVPFTPDVQAS